MVGISGDRRRKSLFAGAVAAVAALSVVLLGGSAAGGTPSLSLRSVGSFDQPIYVTSAPGAGGFLYVVEQDGQIRVVDHGTVKATPFLNIDQRVLAGGEQGLLSMAFDPGYQSNHLFYVGIHEGRRRPRRSTSSTRPRTPARTGSRAGKVIVVPHPDARQPQRRPAAVRARRASLHLDAATAATGGDNAQHLNVLLGKLLRINPHKHGNAPYTVPGEQPLRRPQPGRTRSTRTDSATRGGSRSTRRTGTSRSGTSAKDPGRRSITSRAAARRAPTSAGRRSRGTPTTTRAGRIPTRTTARRSSPSRSAATPRTARSSAASSFIRRRSAC